MVNHNLSSKKGFKRVWHMAIFATVFLFMSMLPSLNCQTYTTVTNDILFLVLTVEEMNIQSGIWNSLDAKLDAALNAIDDLNANNDKAALNSMVAFTNAVEAQQGKQISDFDAALLLIDANIIISKLERIVSGVCPICGGTTCVPPCPNAEV